MSKLQPAIRITIEPNWLKSGYFVYICRIIYKNKAYLYVGQTGDNFHTSARGPFYRISGHLDKTESSDQNQIIKGLRSKILKNKPSCPESLEEVLVESTIEYFYWKVGVFMHNPENIYHEEKRKETQFIEHWMVWQLQKIMKNNKGIELFNGTVVNEVSDSKKKFFNPSKIAELKNNAKQNLKELGYE